MEQDTPPSDAEILTALHKLGKVVEPTALVGLLSADHEMANVIEALQRALERGQITLNSDGMIIEARTLAHAA